MTLQPPEVPLFIAGTTGPNMAAAMNSLVRDKLQYLLDPPTVRLRRTGAFNVTENRHNPIPFDTADEDSESGWTAPAAVGGGGSTTLSGGTAIGAVSGTLTSAANFATGDLVRIGTGAQAEYRTISLSGSTITVPALNLAHAGGETVVEVTSDPTKYYAQAPGWYGGTVTVSLSGTGAAAMILVPSIAVNGASNTGISGGGGWEGMCLYPPTGVSTQPKLSLGYFEVYANVGDPISADLFYSTESAITAVDTTAGLECSMRLVWMGL